MVGTARADALSAIKVGDIIYGIADGGQQKILLVYRADKSRIFARHITTQMNIEFGRDGISRRARDGGSCRIVSTASIPKRDYQIAIGLDKKMRAAKGLADLRLSEAEIQLLLTVHDYFKAHPLPA